MGLAWSLEGSLPYYANAELEVTIEMTALEAGAHYLIGALYTRDGSYIPGTVFGIVVPEGSEFGVISMIETKTWLLAVGESKVLPCKLAIDRTGVVLGLFLMKMAGELASLDSDIIVAQVSAFLSVPTTPVEILMQAAPVIVVLAGLTRIISKGVLHD